MKLFTVDGANEVLRAIAPKLLVLSDLYKKLDELRPDARAAAGASDFGGGMAGGTAYVNSLYEIGKITTEVFQEGIEIKDPARGLIDFPCLRGDRVVYLCWQIGDGDDISWWHEVDAGFAGRQPL